MTAPRVSNAAAKLDEGRLVVFGAVLAGSLLVHAGAFALVAALPSPASAPAAQTVDFEWIEPVVPPPPPPLAPIERADAVVEHPRRASRRAARSEEAPAPLAPVLTAAVPQPHGWEHPAGDEQGRLDGAHHGPGTGALAGDEDGTEHEVAVRGISRDELRRLLIAYIRGTLSSYINGRIDYPLAAQRENMQGVVLLRIRVAEDGRLLSVRLSHSSGYDMLDRAALASVQALGTMPPPPAQIPWDAGQELPLPVTYVLR